MLVCNVYYFQSIEVFLNCIRKEKSTEIALQWSIWSQVVSCSLNGFNSTLMSDFLILLTHSFLSVKYDRFLNIPPLNFKKYAITSHPTHTTPSFISPIPISIHLLVGRGGPSTPRKNLESSIPP